MENYDSTDDDFDMANPFGNDFEIPMMIQNMMIWMKKKINDIPTCGESFVL